MENSNEIVAVVYPSIELKDGWIDRLEQRYDNSGLDKDYKALMNAKDRFEENIKELSESNIMYKIALIDMKYDLEASLIHLENEIDGFLI